MRTPDHISTDELVLAAGKEFGTRLARELLEWMNDNRELVDAWQAEIEWVVPSRYGVLTVPAEDQRFKNARRASVRCVDLNNEDHPDAVRLWIKK